VATAMDIVDDPLPGAAIVTGLKVTVTPLGWPEADSPTTALNEPEMAVVIFDVPLEPRLTESDVGEAEIVKLGATVTVNVTVVVAEVPPPVPVTVIVYLPVGVPAGTAMVMVEFPLPGVGIGLGLKLATGGIATLGETEEVNATGETNPVPMALVIVDVPLEPCATVTDVGEAERVKVAGTATVRLKVAEFVMPLPDPVTVMVYVPGAVEEAAAKVSIEVPEPGAGTVMGLKDAVTPVGMPLADNVIAASNPPVRTGATVVVLLPPCCTVTELGEMLMVKFGAGPDVLERTSSRPTPLGLPQPVTRS